MRMGLKAVFFFMEGRGWWKKWKTNCLYIGKKSCHDPFCLTDEKYES